jgi:Icc-related predicted phosphoesterase
LDNFRTTDTPDWTKVFQVLLDAAPVVLFDGRLSTANLKYEAEAIAKTRYKAVLVISTNDRADVIDSLAPEERTFYSEKSLRIDPTQMVSAVAHSLQAARVTAALTYLQNSPR